MTPTNTMDEGLTLQNLPECPTLDLPPETNLTKTNVHNYIAGYVAKKMLKKIGICLKCKNELICQDRSRDEFSLIRNRAYSHKALLCPNTQFAVLFRKYSYNLSVYIDKYCYAKNLSLVLRQVFSQEDFKYFTCPIHSIKNIFSEVLTKFYIFVWVKNINNSLKGKFERVKDRRNYNKIRYLACQRYQKYKKRQQKYQKMKS